jgi:hypothetical protein
VAVSCFMKLLRGSGINVDESGAGSAHHGRLMVL